MTNPQSNVTIYFFYDLSNYYFGLVKACKYSSVDTFSIDLKLMPWYELFHLGDEVTIEIEYIFVNLLGQYLSDGSVVCHQRLIFTEVYIFGGFKQGVVNS